MPTGEPKVNGSSGPTLKNRVNKFDFDLTFKLTNVGRLYPCFELSYHYEDVTKAKVQ